MAERVRMVVGDLGDDHAGSRYGHITISIGVAVWMPGSDSDASSLVGSADKAMYGAKMAGRNRVVRFEDIAA